MHDTLQRLFRYKAWANDELLTALATLGGESPTTGLAIKALSHSYIVDRIFAAHMRRKAHAYTSANSSEMPTLEDLVRGHQRKRSGVCRLCVGARSRPIGGTDRLRVHGRRPGSYVARGDAHACDHPRHRSSRTDQRSHAAQFRSTGEGWFHDLSARGGGVDATPELLNVHCPVQSCGHCFPGQCMVARGLDIVELLGAPGNQPDCGSTGFAQHNRRSAPSTRVPVCTKRAPSSTRMEPRLRS